MEAKSLQPAPGDALDLSIAKRFMSEVARVKAVRKISTADLAEMYNAFSPNDPIQPTTLNNLLAGKRKALTVGEVIIFTLALDLNLFNVIPLLRPRDSQLRDAYRNELIADLLRLP